MTAQTPRTAEEFMSALSGLIDAYNRHRSVGDVEDARRGQVVTAATDPTRAPAAALEAKESHSPPWHGLAGEGPGVNLAPSAELYAKMQWVGKNVPGGMSMRGLVLAATEEYVAKLITMHYKQN